MLGRIASVWVDVVDALSVNNHEARDPWGLWFIYQQLAKFLVI